MTESFRQIIIDDSPNEYQDFLPESWTRKIDGMVNQGSILDTLLLDLLLAWRSTSFTASMPLMLTKSVHSGIEGVLNNRSWNESVVIFGSAILDQLLIRLPELTRNHRLQLRLSTEITTISERFRPPSPGNSRNLPVDKLWDNFLSVSAFRLSVWSTQRVAFIAFVNSYEAFVINIVKAATGVSSIQTKDRQFRETLKTGFSRDIYSSCWTKKSLHIARQIRHCLSHADGVLTQSLESLNDGIRSTEDHRLHVFPEDNKRILSDLQSGVEAIVEVANEHPTLSQPSNS